MKYRYFQDGYFVVKIGKTKYNQVDPDQAQEWLNDTGKRGGGIVGITKTITALSRWALSFNLRLEIAINTRLLYGMSLDEGLSHKESNSNKTRFCVFNVDRMPCNTIEMQSTYVW